MKPWLIYALGGGWGHLNRAVALGRVAARQRAVTILTNSPYAEQVRVSLKNSVGDCAFPLHLNIIAADAGFGSTCDWVRQQILSLPYQCAIVDTFPRGLGGELADLPPQSQDIPWILVHRDLKPDYVRTKGLRAFVQQFYRAIVIPGDGEDVPFADLPHVYRTAPWLVLNGDELPDRARVRSRLNLPDRQDCDHTPFPDNETCQHQAPILMVCAAGQPSELAFFGRLTAHLCQAFPTAAVRCLAPCRPPHCPPELWISHWPGMEYLQVADIVIGGAGYNTVHECAALDIPLVNFAFPRLYDRQARRADWNGYAVQTIPAAINTLQSLLQQSTYTKILNRISTYSNGAVSAVQQIERVIDSLSQQSSRDIDFRYDLEG